MRAYCLSTTLTPSRLRGWQKSWSGSDIQLSFNNQGETTDITFYMNPSTDITSGVLEITFPTEFNPGVPGWDTALHPGCTVTVDGQLVSVQPINFVSNTDMKVTITGIVNESSGPYGPFALLTRWFSEGQIIDINKNFGSIYIMPIKGELNNFTVAIPEESPTTIQEETKLEFSFTISQDLWKHDIFEIQIDDDWEVGTSPIWNSAPYQVSYDNYINGTQSDASLLAWAATAKVTGQPQTLYIYGLAYDVDSSNKSQGRFVKLEIDQVTAPKAVYGRENYNWIMRTMRWQTRTIIDEATGNGPNVIAGVIETASYEPTWGIEKTLITQNHILFMEVSFSVAHRLDDGGTAVIKLTEDVNGQAWGGADEQAHVSCYYTDVLLRSDGTTFASWSTSDPNIINITNLPSRIRNEAVNVRVSARFTLEAGTLSSITEITTYTGGFVVDQTTGSLAVFQTAQNTYIAVPSAVGVTFGDNTQTSLGSMEAGGPDETQGASHYLKLYHVTPSTWDDSTTISFHCPLNDLNYSDTEFFIQKTGAYNVGAAIDSTALNSLKCDGSAGTWEDMTTGSGKDYETPVITSSGFDEAGKIEWAAPGASGTKPQANEGYTVCYNNQAAFPMGVPAAASNAASKLECWVDGRTSTAPLPFARYVGFTGPLSFTERTLGATNTVELATCNFGVPGTIGILTISLNRTPIVVGNSKIYYVDFIYETEDAASGASDSKFVTRMDSGLQFGDSYPFYSAKSNSMSATIEERSTGVEAIRFNVWGAVPTTETIVAHLPLGIPADTDANGKTNDSGWSNTKIIIWYYASGFDTRFREVYYKDVITVAPMAVNTGAAWQILTEQGDAWKNGASTNLEINIAAKAGGANNLVANSMVQIMLPSGYTVETEENAYMRYNSVEYEDVRVFQSSINTFKYPSIQAKVPDNANALIDDLVDDDELLTHLNIGFGTIVARPGILGADDSTRWVIAGTANGSCLNASTINWTTNWVNEPVYFSPNAINPGSVHLYGGPYSTDQTITFSFSNNVRIPSGGSIELIAASVWGYWENKTYCTASGMPDFSPDLRVQCTTSSSLNFLVDQIGYVQENTTIEIVAYRVSGPTDELLKGTRVGWVGTLQSKDASGNVIETWNPDEEFTADNMSIGNIYTPGRSSDHVWNAYPNTAGTSSGDIRMEFQLPYDMTTDGIIQVITPFTLTVPQSGDLKASCWSNIKYASCRTTYGVLEIVLGEDVSKNNAILIYLDEAVLLPRDTTQQERFSIQAKVNDAYLVNDELLTDVQASRTFTAAAQLTQTIAVLGNIAFYPKNAGELATYELPMRLSTDLQVGDKIKVHFPKQFDPLIGDAQIRFESEPNTYYIECEADILTTSTWWEVSHWTVTITNDIGIVAFENDIIIKIKNVSNPYITTLAWMKVSHLNSNDEYIAYKADFDSILTQSLPDKNILVYSIATSDQHMSQTDVDFTFKYYFPVDTTLSNFEETKVVFPSQFDLAYNRVVANANYTWSSVTVDTTQSVQEEYSWNTATACSVENNIITLSPSSDASTLIRAWEEITWRISGLVTPQWSLPRTAEDTWDFDESDDTIFTDYQYWVNKWQLIIYDTSAPSLLYTARTYANTNSAYLGFNYAKQRLLVNNYNAADSSSRIQIVAGTQTNDIPISVDSQDINQMTAKMILLEPSINSGTPDDGKMTFTSRLNEFKIYQEQQTIYFRIAADISLAKGLYYIDWKITETVQIGAIANSYQPPVSTLVEVISASNYNIQEVKLELNTGLLTVGIPSLPLLITIPNAPESEVIITPTITLGSTQNVEFIPGELKFLPDIQEQYFRISIGATHSTTDSAAFEIQLFITGNKADLLYSNDLSYAFGIQEDTFTDEARVEGTILAWGDGECTANTCSINPSVTHAGVLYFALSARKEGPNDVACPTYEYLKTTVGNLEDTEYPLRWDEQVKQETQNIETDPKSGEDWVAFQYRLYKTHLQKQWVGSISMYTLSNVKTVEFTWLWASTEYQICGYLENIFGNASVVDRKYLFTPDMDVAMPWSIQFEGTLSTNLATTIREKVSVYQGVHPKRNIDLSYESRRLQDGTHTTFSYTLYANRQSSSPTTAELIAASATKSSIAKIQPDLIPHIEASIVSLVADSPSERTAPVWFVVPTLGTTTATSQEITLRASIAGQMSCIAVEGHAFDQPSSRPSSEQVFYHLDSSNVAVPGNGIVTNTGLDSQKITIEDLKSNQEYTIFCTSTDDYPLWPTQMYYSDSAPITPLYTKTTTSGKETNDDSSSESEDSYAFKIFYPSSILGLLLFIIS